MPTTRTIGPLHFEDLEPKRFEDLVRQLIYDFKPWRRLEATGRSGNDDGFDARGYEIVIKTAQASDASYEDEAIEEQSSLTEGTGDRLWLIQCKRERSIGPRALVSYLDDTVLHKDEGLHGLVFTAACDFSKKARDAFAEKCREMELEEWHLWGKAELEDRLFRPENDHLLFAYFGISLTIRRRTQQTELRARLAMKRKANRILKEYSSSFLLLRSPDALTYPYSDSIADFEKSPLWVVCRYMGMSHNGLKFCVKRFFAYLADDGKSWDAAMALNEAKSSRFDDPWLGRDRNNEKRRALHDLWSNIPETNKAWLEVIGIVPFEEILDIDDLGDEYMQAPHIYVPFGSGERGPFSGFIAKVEPVGRCTQGTYYPETNTDHRIEYFPREFRQENEE